MSVEDCTVYHIALGRFVVLGGSSPVSRTKPNELSFGFFVLQKNCRRICGEKASGDGGSRCCIAVRTRMENPGRSGVEKMTVAMLMENTIAAAEKRPGL